jgi:rare lipoprotein A
MGGHVKGKSTDPLSTRVATAVALLLLLSQLPVAANWIGDDDLEWELTAAAAPIPELPPAHCVSANDVALAADLQAMLPVELRGGGEEPIIGVASFYDDPQETASGEAYDPNAFTAAAQLDIRSRFGGIQFGKNYQPAYALVEYADKKLILKFNDVGPLMPGRKFDLSRAAMRYFDGLGKGLLADVKVTPLPLGQAYVAGPVIDADITASVAPDKPAHAPQPPQAEPSVAASPMPIGDAAILASMYDG